MFHHSLVRFTWYVIDRQLIVTHVLNTSLGDLFRLIPDERQQTACKSAC